VTPGRARKRVKTGARVSRAHRICCARAARKTSEFALELAKSLITQMIENLISHARLLRNNSACVHATLHVLAHDSFAKVIITRVYA
jgi:hypothetical protein